MSAHPQAGVGASAVSQSHFSSLDIRAHTHSSQDQIDVIARDAYLFFLQQGHETLGNSPDLKKVADREVEMVVDQALTDRALFSLFSDEFTAY